MDLSIIIPFLNEEIRLKKNVVYYRKISKILNAEIIFVDGQSHDRSSYYATKVSNKVYNCRPQRARQMNLGAANANGKYLLFLHADTILNDISIKSLENIINNLEWGFFSISFNSNKTKYKLLSKCINTRSKLFNYSTGDQCLLIKKELFNKINGFKDLDLMEDVEISNRLKKLFSPHILPGFAMTSHRKWESHGFLRTIAKMRILRFMYFIGFSTKFLNKLYYK